jgi:hypothetical protein
VPNCILPAFDVLVQEKKVENIFSMRLDVPDVEKQNDLGGYIDYGGIGDLYIKTI